MTHNAEKDVLHRPALDERGSRTGLCTCGDGYGHHLPQPADADNFEPPTVGSEVM